jgi:Flp pilus assembly pilin Flp
MRTTHDPHRTVGTQGMLACAEARAHRGRGGFTMVEIALCLGVIAFALVAIIGVLPTGLKVQKDNATETVINQDGLYLLEAIRGGAAGSYELTNYFDLISVSNRFGSTNFIPNVRNAAHVAGGTGPALPLVNVIGLLSTPRFEVAGGVYVTNFVRAHVRAITGPAATKDPQLRDVAFSYLLTSEVVPVDYMPAVATNWHAGGLARPELLARSNNWRTAVNVASNFHELRLTLSYPLFKVGDRWETGGGVRSFRTTIAGAITNIHEAGVRYFYVQPNQFAQIR